MNLQAITVSKKEARAAVRHYKETLRKKHNVEDLAMLRGFQEVAAGRELINLADVFSKTPLDEKERPRLALCQANQKVVYCEIPYAASNCYFYWQVDGRLARWSTPRRSSLPERYRRMPIPQRHGHGETLKTMVPNIPPQFRPPRLTKNHFLLWEVEKWEVYPPHDPALLRHIGGSLYALLATWDMTELERAVLMDLRS